jgi:hypothetical protein
MVASAGVIAGGTPARAQEQSGFPVIVLACGEDPGDIHIPMEGFPPEGCLFVLGVTVLATAEDGSTLGSCTTDRGGGCSLPVPPNGSAMLTQDRGTLPAGYASRVDPLLVGNHADFSTGVVVNLPVTPSDGVADRGASLAIHAAECPVDYAGDDRFADCYDTVGPRSLDFRVSSDAEQLASNWAEATGGRFGLELDPFAPGMVRIEALEPREAGIAHAPAVVGCSVAGERISVTSVEADDNDGRWSVAAVEIAVGPNDDVRCDWYTMPVWDEPGAAGGFAVGNPGEPQGGASLTIHLYGCPLNDGDYPRNPCPDLALEGERLTLNGPVSREGLTGEWARLVFPRLPAGDYLVGGVVPTVGRELDAVCTPAFHSEVVVPTATRRAHDSTGAYVTELTLGPDDDVHCEFYVTPHVQAAPILERDGG